MAFFYGVGSHPNSPVITRYGAGRCTDLDGLKPVAPNRTLAYPEGEMQKKYQCRYYCDGRICAIDRLENPLLSRCLDQAFLYFAFG